jgi:hypothetical protein
MWLATNGRNSLRQAKLYSPELEKLTVSSLLVASQDGPQGFTLAGKREGLCRGQHPALYVLESYTG